LSGQRKSLHPAKPKDVIKALSKIGFVARHTKGSHVHIRLEGEEPSDYKEFIRRFMEILALIPKIQRVIK